MLNQVSYCFQKQEFDEIIISFTGQKGRSLEIEDKVNLTFLINKQKRQAFQFRCTSYSKSANRIPQTIKNLDTSDNATNARDND